jgi:hypothetical protein
MALGGLCSVQRTRGVSGAADPGHTTLIYSGTSTHPHLCVRRGSLPRKALHYHYTIIIILQQWQEDDDQ